MASITSDSNGRKRLQFSDANGKRRTVRLGKMSKRKAETVKTHVEHLIAAKITRQAVEGETARWVAGLDDVLSERLARAGLIAKRESALLHDFIEAYAENRTDLKPRTLIKFNATRDYLTEFFGRDRPLRDISPGLADDWRLYLIGKGLSENTVRKHAQIAKQFFTAAVRKKLIDENPFSDLKATVRPNPDRYYFVTREEADRVLEACPDAEWRLIFALSRYGGLRCPSEHLALTWDCIDWSRNRIRVPSPKTAHHDGKAFRMIPIFPELRPHLELLFEQAAEGAVHVITRYRDANSNLRTQLQRIIGRAGLIPWPKLFQNLRSTRETELAEEYPLHVVCEWIGNSKTVAAKHYLQVTDEHFEKATQNPTQSVHAGGGQAETQNTKTLEKSWFDHPGHFVSSVQVVVEGLEQSQQAPGQTASSEKGDAESDA